MRNSKCVLCGKKFRIRTKRGYQKYCGNYREKSGCSYKALLEKFARWRLRHIKKARVYWNTHKTRRKKLLERYDYTCKKCCLKNNQKGFLDIDHIDGNHKNNSSGNLQVLCPNCHRIKTIQDQLK